MGQKNYCVVSGSLFSLVALAHLLRIVYGMSVKVEEYVVPMFFSWVALIIAAALGFWAFRMSRGQALA